MDLPGIRWHDRAFVLGYTSSGKSEMLNYLFSMLRTQKLLLDTKPEFTIPGVKPVSRVEDIDWREPIIHFRDVANELEAYDQLFWECLHRRDLTVCVHEMADLCDDQPARTPTWVRRYLRQGNVYGDGLFGGSQRPVGMPRQGRTEAQHVIHMVPALDPEDHKIAAKMMHTGVYQLHKLLEEAAGKSPSGKFSSIWYDRRADSTAIIPPLSEGVRSRIIVRRAVDLDKPVGEEQQGERVGTLPPA